MHYKLQLPKILAVIFLTLSISLSPLFVTVNNVQAESLEEELERLEQELEYIRGLQGQLENNISNEQNLQGVYRGEIGQIRGEVEAMQLKIAETDIQIKELEVGIEQLETLIQDKELELAENEIYVAELESQTDKRIEQGYKDYRTHRQNRVDLFNVKDPNTYFRDSQYRELIQAKSNIILEDLTALKEKLNRDREDLEEKQVAIRRDRALLEEQQSQISKIEEELKTKMDGYYSAIYTSQNNIANANSALQTYTEEESRKMAEAERIRQELFNQVNSIPNGQYVVAGTQIGNQGSTGWSTGPHLHFMVKKNGSYRNPCDFLDYQVSSAEGSCGWGSGMEWPMKGNFYYTSRFYGGGSDSRCFNSNGVWTCGNHLAIDVANTIWNAPIYAAHSGWLYKSVDQYGALYIIICQDKNNCNNGLQTGYWHLSAY